jgi:hypothetical protein
MPHHVVIRLPDGRIACADYRQPVVRSMRKINDAISRCKLPDPALYEPISAWLDQHLDQSAVCHAGLSPSGLPCGHD